MRLIQVVQILLASVLRGSAMLLGQGAMGSYQTLDSFPYYLAWSSLLFALWQAVKEEKFSYKQTV